MSDVHYIGEARKETLTGLRDANGYVNDAAVAYSLKGPGGVELDSGTYAYEAASNGNYSVTLPASVTLQEQDGQTYYLWVTISVSGTQVGERRLPRPAQYRGAE